MPVAPKSETQANRHPIIPVIPVGECPAMLIAVDALSYSTRSYTRRGLSQHKGGKGAGGTDHLYGADGYVRHGGGGIALRRRGGGGADGGCDEGRGRRHGRRVSRADAGADLLSERGSLSMAWLEFDRRL